MNKLFIRILRAIITSQSMKRDAKVLNEKYKGVLPC